MRKSGIITFSVIVLLSSFACDNENTPDCLKKTGDLIEKEILLDRFESIHVKDEVDIHLHNSNERRVVLKAGKNLIQEIDFEINDEVLTISNYNRCNWRRSSGNPDVYIYSDEVTKISIFDYSNVYTSDTLTLSRLDLYSDGTGDFEMIVDIDTLSVESRYVSNFQFSGRVNYLNIYFTYDGKFLGQYLQSSYCEVIHDGSNRIELFPVLSLTGKIQSTGDLYYYNVPLMLDITVTGTGKLVNVSK